MKIPKTFISEKSLENKIEGLLSSIEAVETSPTIDPEAEKLFPNFIEYLKKECDSVHIKKSPDNQAWVIYDEEKTGISVLKGYIHEHEEKEGIVSAYGYKVTLKIRKKCLELFYRIKFTYNNPEKGLTSTVESPVRYDAYDIPFP